MGHLHPHLTAEKQGRDKLLEGDLGAGRGRGSHGWDSTTSRGPPRIDGTGRMKPPRLRHEGDVGSQRVCPGAPGRGREHRARQEAWRSFSAPQQVWGLPLTLVTRLLENLATDQRSQPGPGPWCQLSGGGGIRPSDVTGQWDPGSQWDPRSGPNPLPWGVAGNCQTSPQSRVVLTSSGHAQLSLPEPASPHT